MTTLLLPHTIELSLADVGGRRVVNYDAAAPDLPEGAAEADVMVVWQNSPENLLAATRLPRLRLVQTLAAGPDAVVAAGFDARVSICSGRSLHDATVAEHTLALLLHLVRRLDALAASQRAHRWDEEFRKAQEHPATTQLFTLGGRRVAILGFGSIAQRLTPLLVLLGAEVVGVARRAGVRDGTVVHGFDQLERVVSEADAVISLLPSSDQTRHLVDTALLSRFRPDSVFINVGRGSTVDEKALRLALVSGRLRAAALDVMEQEPLPTFSPLWNTPNLLLTPHVAGNRPQGAEALIVENLGRLDRGEMFENLVSSTHQIS